MPKYEAVITQEPRELRRHLLHCRFLYVWHPDFGYVKSTKVAFNENLWDMVVSGESFARPYTLSWEKDTAYVCG